MALWRIKEMSDLTNVSVRMLRHYDKIGLLKPSMRTSNGYRWYSEQDLVALQQIIALKFFGFSLATIKTMVQQKQSISQNLHAQQEMLKGQVESLRLALDTLGTVLEKYEVSKTLDWKHLIELIERYRMAEEIKDTWVAKLNAEQQERYLVIRQKYPQEIKGWEEAVEAINNKQLGDPDGPDGERVAKAFLKHADAVRMFEETMEPKKMTSSDASKLLKTIKKFKVDGVPLSPEGNVWFAKAMIAHQLRGWQRVHQEIKKNLAADPASETGKKLANTWRDFIAEQTMGSPNDFFLGTMLLMKLARSKADLQGQPVQPDDTALLLDPMATDWILKALKAH